MVAHLIESGANLLEESCVLDFMLNACWLLAWDGRKGQVLVESAELQCTNTCIVASSFVRSKLVHECFDLKDCSLQEGPNKQY